MKIVMFYQSLISDWNHGNAHFLRGIASELLARGHQIAVYEPRNSRCVTSLVADHGAESLNAFRTYYPMLDSIRYDERTFDYNEALAGAHLVIVHEWNTHSLVAQVGKFKRIHNYCLLFHNTHHRSVTDPKSMAAYDLREYDGVLAYGEAIRKIYAQERWASNSWTWHEAADTRAFYPRERKEYEGDVVWIGNWGDEERSEELREFLVEPVRTLGLRCKVFGVRYPEWAKRELSEAGISYGGWLPNFHVPEVFAQYKLTVHIPRKPYIQQLSGIPTIRPFEALACGIPLISGPWIDAENVFRDDDFLIARNGEEMTQQMHRLLDNAPEAEKMATRGLHTIRLRHTCTHRVDELMAIYNSVTGVPAPTIEARS